MLRRTRWRRTALVLIVLSAVMLTTGRWWPGWYWSWRTDNPVRRGADLAAREGCLSCHLAMGSQETANPGSRWGTVPSFFRGNAMMYVTSPRDVAHFIAEGHAPGAAAAPAKAGGPGSPPFRMRAFKDRLDAGQIRDLAAFVLAADGFGFPSEGPVARGAELSAKFGCESCHGAGGSGGVLNGRSFTGTVPGWIGPDFSDLVRTRAEFSQWVLDGRSERMKTNAAAAFFLDRANLQMPAYRGALDESEVEQLWTYLQWLRVDAQRTAAGRP